MEIAYKKDGNKSTMTIKGIEVDENDYKLQMVINNHIDGILAMNIEHINNQSIVTYNISSKTRLSDLYAKKQMLGKELYGFIKDIKILAERMNEYLLDINDIAFDMQLIYFNRQTGKYEFCYIPRGEGDFQIRIRDLFDKLLEYINYNDKEAVMIAYGIQQLTIGVDFTLQDILKCAYENIREFQQEKQQEEKKNPEIKRKEIKKQEKVVEEKKRGILDTIQALFQKKDKYRTEDEIEWEEDFEEEGQLIVAEDPEPYNQREEKTVILTNPEVAKGIRLTAVGTENPIKIIPVNFPYIVGKSECSCDFCIDSAVVSRVHMRILEELDVYFIEDLNSTNGTFINGEKLEAHKPQPISAGDKLTIANMDFIVEERV